MTHPTGSTWAKVFECWFPWAIAILAGLVGYFYACDGGIPTRFCHLLNVTVSISAIAVGFLGTAMAILMSITKKKLVELMKRGTGEYFDRLIDFLITAILSCCALALLSGFGLLFDFSVAAEWHHLGFGIWLGVLSLAASTCWRIISIFAMVLKSE